MEQGSKTKRKGESISKEDYTKCYTPTSSSTSEKEKEQQIKKAFEIALDTRKFEIGLYWKRTASGDSTSVKDIDEDLIKRALEIALDTRKFEIDLYWKRTAYFVLFISAVFIGYYKIIQTNDLIIGIYQKEWLLLLLAALGFLLSLLWYIANRGSKFWQENWEAHIEQLSTYSGVPIFGIIKRREHSVRNLMQEYPFSVSKVNQMVSLIITFTWLIMLCKEMGLSKLLENIAYSCWYKVIVGGIVIMLSFAIIICCKGFAAKVAKKGEKCEERKWIQLLNKILRSIGLFRDKIIDIIKYRSTDKGDNESSDFFWNYNRSWTLKEKDNNEENKNQ